MSSNVIHAPVFCLSMMIIKIIAGARISYNNGLDNSITYMCISSLPRLYFIIHHSNICIKVDIRMFIKYHKNKTDLFSFQIYRVHTGIEERWTEIHMLKALNVFHNINWTLKIKLHDRQAMYIHYNIHSYVLQQAVDLA